MRILLPKCNPTGITEIDRSLEVRKNDSIQLRYTDNLSSRYIGVYTKVIAMNLQELSKGFKLISVYLKARENTVSVMLRLWKGDRQYMFIIFQSLVLMQGPAHHEFLPIVMNGKFITTGNKNIDVVLREYFTEVQSLVFAFLPESFMNTELIKPLIYDRGPLTESDIQELRDSINRLS